jgi:adenosine deaminase
MSLDSFISGLPKAELHLHIEGSLEPDLMFALARRNRIALPFATVDQLRAAYEFSKLQDFLDLYYQGAQVLLQPEDFQDLALAYFRRAAADGVRHAEIFFDPQTHTSRGVPLAAVMQGLLAAITVAERELGLSVSLILCFLRHLDEDDALGTLRQAEPWLGQLTGVGLDSSELGHPPAKFVRVFRAAAERGLRLVAHAGEEGPPDYVRQALELLRVERIDHGNRALEDPGLVVQLARRAIPLTVCPLSNLKLQVVTDLARHPLAEMLRHGLRATVNSDDPAYFGGYINDNYRAVATGLALDRAAVASLARNSFLGSFLPDDVVLRHLASLESYLSQCAL